MSTDTIHPELLLQRRRDGWRAWVTLAPLRPWRTRTYCPCGISMTGTRTEVKLLVGGQHFDMLKEPENGPAHSKIRQRWR